MVADSERYRSEDAALRQQIDARNELDAAAYAVQHRLEELGDALPVHEKARAESLVHDARELLRNEDAGVGPLRSMSSDLQQVAQSLSSGRSQRDGQEDGSANGGQDTGDSDEDVIDADFTVS